MATDDTVPVDDDEIDQNELVRRLFEEDFERHRDIYEALEDE